MSRILVISPHPDDEVIGCGGTLRKHVLDGDPVHTVFLTSGEGGGHGRDPESTARLREQEAQAAATVVGIESIEFWREPDGQFRVTQAAVDRLRRKLRNWEPDTIYVTHDREMHRDHRSAVRLVRRALATSRRRDGRPALLMYEVWTPLDRMTHIVDISPYIETKLAAIRAYKTQCDVLRFDEAMLGLARYRGEMHSWPGGEYVEVFKEVRP